MYTHLFKKADLNFKFHKVTFPKTLIYDISNNLVKPLKCVKPRLCIVHTQ